MAGNITQISFANGLSQLWAAQPEYAVNNMRGVSKSVWDTGETYVGPGFKVHFPIIGSIAAAAYTGAALSFTNNTESEIAITPSVIYAAVQIQEDVNLTGAYDLVRTYTPELAEGLYQKLDIDLLSQHTFITTNDSTDAGEFTAATFQGLVSKMLNTGGDKVQLGQIDGWYSPLKWDAILQIADFTNASVRGESNSSAKTGNLGMAFGVNFNFSANVITSTTIRNVLLSRKTLVIVRKNRPKVEMERTDLTTKVVASMMYGVSVLHQISGGVHRITTTT